MCFEKTRWNTTVSMQLTSWQVIWLVSLWCMNYINQLLEVTVWAGRPALFGSNFGVSRTSLLCPVQLLVIDYCLFLCVCTVTDFSGEDKASGVKFCTAVQRRPAQGISHFGELCLPRKPKIGRIGHHREVKFRVWGPTVNVTLQVRRSGNIARRVEVGRHVWI